MAASRIGLMGGTFDPIHLGHLIVARSVFEQLNLNELIFIPAAQPPHKGDRSVTSFGNRAKMVKLAIVHQDAWVLDECENKRQGPSYTLDTVKYFKKQKGSQTRIYWIIGADSLSELHSWHQVGDLVNACEIVTVCRPGWEKPTLSGLEELLSPSQLAQITKGILETPRIDISSTDIRQRVSAGLSINFLVPETVLQFIQDHQLYRDLRQKC